MQVHFKYFQTSSISFVEKRFEYPYSENSTLAFNNYFQSFEKAQKILVIANKRIQDFKSVRDINDLKSQIESKNKNKKSGFRYLEDMSDIERIIVVLRKYGLNKDFIVNEILGGYPSEYLGNDELEVKGVFINKPNLLFEIPIHVNLPVKERMICLAKNEGIYPLFVDVNHDLFTQHKIKYDSQFCISSLMVNLIFSK